MQESWLGCPSMRLAGDEQGRNKAKEACKEGHGQAAWGACVSLILESLSNPRETLLFAFCLLLFASYHRPHILLPCIRRQPVTLSDAVPGLLTVICAAPPVLFKPPCRGARACCRHCNDCRVSWHIGFWQPSPFRLRTRPRIQLNPGFLPQLLVGSSAGLSTQCHNPFGLRNGNTTIWLETSGLSYLLHLEKLVCTFK